MMAAFLRLALIFKLSIYTDPRKGGWPAGEKVSTEVYKPLRTRRASAFGLWIEADLPGDRAALRGPVNPGPLPHGHE